MHRGRARQPQTRPVIASSFQKAFKDWSVAVAMDVSHLRYTNCMKTATIPSVRVEPELRAEVESVLGDGETVSEFVEASVRAAVLRRRNQTEFIARGMNSLEDARRTGGYVDVDEVVEGLQRKLEAARIRKPAKQR